MLLALVFNPLVPLHLTRPIWQIIDVIAALVFTARALTPPPRNPVR